MDFFEKLGKKATETFNNAAEKTNKIASETKIRFKINDCKSKIKDLYQEIGKTVYQKMVLDGEKDIKDDIEEQLTKIVEYTNQIEDYEKQILELADLKQCENCKNKIEKSAKYCPECGAEQPKEEVHEAEVLEDESEISEEVEDIVDEETEEEDKKEE